MKRFFGGVFIEQEKLKEAGISHPIKLEYYKRINEEENIDEAQQKTKYGISIVKTEYIEDNLQIESKKIDNVTDDEKKINKILDIFKENEVTTINFEEVMSDLLKSGI